MKRVWVLMAALVIALAALITRNTIRASQPVPETPGQVRAPHGPVDPEVAEGLTAFSAQQYETARRIGAHLLAERARGSTHAEGLDLIVESWLAEGNFAQARAAARKYQEQVPDGAREALARIENDERHYQRQLARYTKELAQAKRPEEAAELQLHIGHTHRQVGRLQLARESYQEGVKKYPKTHAAVSASRQLHTLAGGRLGEGPKEHS